MKKITKASLTTVTLLLILLIGFPACKTEQPTPKTDIKHPVETAEIISHASSGIIGPNDEISVTFVKPEINDNQINANINTKIFHFSPPIDGITQWKNKRTLIFKPNQPLPYRKTFSAEVHFNKLIPKYKNQKNLLFTFSVAGREIADLKGDFHLQQPNNPNNLIYKGAVSFTDPIPLDTVKKAVSLSMNSQKLQLTWKTEKNNTFAFTSPPLTRTTRSIPFTLSISKENTDISEDIEKQFTLDPLGEFKIKGLNVFDQGQKAGLEIRFSDPLDLNQDITGLVRVQPAVNFTFKKIDKSIFLSGNFSAGQVYNISISGIRSKWATTLESEAQKTISFEDQKPQFSFLKDGLFLPTANEQKIAFKTMNLKQVKLHIKKVFESNLGQFLQEFKLNAQKQRHERFYDYNLRRVGVTVTEQDIPTGNSKNTWQNHVLDLKKIIPKGEKGIFIITLTFSKKDMLYAGLEQTNRYYSGRQYYSNPNSSGYAYRHGTIVKPVIVSDIGLTYKQGAQNHLLFATNLLDAKPLPNTRITLRTYQNQVIAQKTTDSDGKAFFEEIKEKVFYIEGENNDQRSLVKPQEMSWKLSAFDTGGVTMNPDQTRAFIYTERGVYRPGDPINLSIIARNKDNSFPENHPVSIEVFNPKNQLLVKKTAQTGSDGFYNFLIQTKPTDMTGNWRTKIHVGSNTFYHTLKIETVAPNRLKVKILPEKKYLDPTDDRLIFDLQSNYLFGSPAAHLQAEVNVAVSHHNKTFPKYHGFTFNNESIRFKYITARVFKSALDADGKGNIKWQLPALSYAPSAARVNIKAKVFEKGGRFTQNSLALDIDPFHYYVGLEKPRFRWGYSRVGAPVTINWLTLDNKGNPAPGRQLKYKIYKNTRHWWWEYDNRRNFQVRYKKDKYTRLLKEGDLISQGQPQAITFKPQDRGEYFIEVEDAVNGGHKAGFFFSAYYWGDAPSDIDSAGTLALKCDKKSYQPGESAVISFPEPQEGTIFVTVEKANDILSSSIYKAAGGKEETERKINIPITDAMMPNAYVSVSIIQPHSQTLNDRPIRVYGIIPIPVEKKETKLGLKISMKETLRTKEEFQVTVETTDQKPAQLTIAVVDEGLLDLTRFATPSPWKWFFKKQKLGIRTADLFAYVIGAEKGDMTHLISIGGGMDGDYRGGQLEPGKVRRFKPVCLFQGPIKTDDKGKIKISFKMPDYIGSVRVMAVAADGNRYGSVEKTVPVKTELMVMPTLPRVLGPGDRVTLPVTLFVMEEGIKKVDLSIVSEGAVQVEGPNKQTFNFTEPGEKDAAFTIQALPAVGPAAITLTASSGKFKGSSRTDINIRPYSPRIYDSQVKACPRGEKIKIAIPDRGLKGTNRATLHVMRKERLNLDHRMDWLIRYPYGCIEQTVSAVFPQLYLKAFIKNELNTEEEIDRNINEGIERLRRFQLPSGGFAYWPGDRAASIWGTNYAGHFLVEAKKLGYHVPEDLFNRWLRFQESRALTGSDGVMTRCYRVYGMALAGKGPLGSMNLLKENESATMPETAKWMLAAAYHLAGNTTAAQEIAKKTAIEVADYHETGGTYGSRLRDLAIILDVLTLFQDWNKADPLYDQILEEVSGNAWHSTQALGFSLMAAGKYIRANSRDFRGDSATLSGYIKLPGKKKIPFNTTDLRFSQVIETGFGGEAEIFLDKKTTLERGFAVVDWNGIPLMPDVKDVSKGLWVTVEWLDENGTAIDPAQIRQGTSFWGHFRVGKVSYKESRLEELALVQVLPSGWEIENQRLNTYQMPRWMKKWKMIRPDYLDIRDDRIIWFFDLPMGSQSYDFAVKLTAITAGQFMLPPTLVEAMYNNRYQATKKGKFVRVVPR